MLSYVVGSSLLNLKNCHDVDRIYFADSPVPTLPTQTGDYFCKNLDFIKLILAKSDHPEKFAKDFNRPVCGHFFQYSRGFHPEPEYPIEWDIMEHKQGWKQILKNHITHEEAEEYYILENGICRKTLYNIAYQYYMLLDDTIWVTGEHLDIVQKIHDRQMPAEYFYELREQILAL